MASLFGWPFFLIATNCELKTEDCEPTAIANRRLTADWGTNCESRAYCEVRTNDKSGLV
jgi:hypothetical protein